MGSVGAAIDPWTRLTSARRRVYDHHATNDLPISPVLPLVDKRVLSVWILRHDDSPGTSDPLMVKIIIIIGPIHLLFATRHAKQATSLYLSSAL